MTRWNYDPRTANRGKQLEEDILASCFFYQNRKIASIRKIPTPIKPISVDWRRKIITKAVFDEKSSVDFEGNYRGKHIAFDAKETSVSRLPLDNIEQHQYEYLKFNHDLGGISFLIVSFTELKEVYYLPFNILDEYWSRRRRGGRKSIPYSDFVYQIKPGLIIRLDFLENVDRYLKQKEVI